MNDETRDSHHNKNHDDEMDDDDEYSYAINKVWISFLIFKYFNEGLI